MNDHEFQIGRLPTHIDYLLLPTYFHCGSCYVTYNYSVTSPRQLRVGQKGRVSRRLAGKSGVHV